MTVLLAAPAAAVHRGPERLLLHVLFAVGVFLLFLAAVGAMRRGWRRRSALTEDLPDLLAPPAEAGVVLAAPLKGLYLGTVDAGHWLDRVTAQGLGGRADGYVGVYEAGIRVDRAGAEPFWIPRDAVRGARLERAHAGKVMGPGRIVVIAWSFGGRELETGFRGSDRPRQPKIVRAVHELFGPAPARVLAGETTHPQPLVRAFPRLRRHHPPAAPQAPSAPSAHAGQAGPTGQARPAGQAGPAGTRRTNAPPPRAVHRPAAAPGPGDVDPLTSPLRDVVRRLRDQP